MSHVAVTSTKGSWTVLLGQRSIWSKERSHWSDSMGWQQHQLFVELPVWTDARIMSDHWRSLQMELVSALFYIFMERSFSTKLCGEKICKFILYPELVVPFALAQLELQGIFLFCDLIHEHIATQLFSPSSLPFLICSWLWSHVHHD